MNSRSGSKRRFYEDLSDLGFASYSEYLASDHWQDVRLRFYAKKSRRKCGGCFARSGLAIHHKTDKRLGHEHLQDLVALCRPCHVAVHRVEANTEKDAPTLWHITRQTLRKFRKAKRRASAAGRTWGA